MPEVYLLDLYHTGLNLPRLPYGTAVFRKNLCYLLRRAAGRAPRPPRTESQCTCSACTERPPATCRAVNSEKRTGGPRASPSRAAGWPVVHARPTLEL